MRESPKLVPVGATGANMHMHMHATTSHYAVAHVPGVPGNGHHRSNSGGGTGGGGGGGLGLGAAMGLGLSVQPGPGHYVPQLPPVLPSPTLNLPSTGTTEPRTAATSSGAVVLGLTPATQASLPKGARAMTLDGAATVAATGAGTSAAAGTGSGTGSNSLAASLGPLVPATAAVGVRASTAVHSQQQHSGHIVHPSGASYLQPQHGGHGGHGGAHHHNPGMELTSVNSSNDRALYSGRAPTGEAAGPGAPTAELMPITGGSSP
jgi:hypothetical protein